MSYRDDVLRTAKVDDKSLIHAAMGLAGESGEVVDLIKKHIFYDTPLDEHKLIKELGDIRWYLEFMAITLGISMEFIEKTNVEKLQRRYPNGFSSKDALEKKDE